MEEKRIKAKLDILKDGTKPVRQLLIDFYNFRIKIDRRISDEQAIVMFMTNYIKKLQELEKKDSKQQKLF